MSVPQALPALSGAAALMKVAGSPRPSGVLGWSVLVRAADGGDLFAVVTGACGEDLTLVASPVIHNTAQSRLN
jgi:hypothetical protein